MCGEILPDVQQIRAPVARLALAQQRRQGRVGLVALGRHVDEQRHHRRALVAQRVQLRLVEGGVRDGEAALPGEARQLRAPERGLVGDVRLPVAQQRGRSDVVVVHQLGLGPRGQDVVDRAPDRCLIQQPPFAPRPAELGDRTSLVLDVGGEAAVVDVGLHPRGAQAVAQVERVHADGVAAGERRDHLVDSHRAASVPAGHHPDCDGDAPIRPRCAVASSDRVGRNLTAPRGHSRGVAPGPPSIVRVDARHAPPRSSSCCRRQPGRPPPWPAPPPSRRPTRRPR